ncbi:MAG: 5'-methylthioadenosine/adenosylhomocysteine nucleosidase [Alphaproteobacteria bacterium]
MLAVIGAMKEEIDLIKTAMTVSATQTHAGIETVQGEFGGVEIVLAQCGIGKVNATICTQMLIDYFQPGALVFSGVAGGLLPNMQVGDVVIASHLIQYDMDLTAFGRRHGEVPGQDSRMVESDPGLVQKAATAFDAAFPASAAGPSLMLGTVVSGDRFIQDPETLRWLQREFSALATEMEGAAVGYTCGLNGVPFVIIRALSDTASESASGDFASNLHKVCENSFRLLECLIPKIDVSGEATDSDFQKAS